MKAPRRVHTPTLLQMEATECGATALGIMLAYYGRWVPLEELRVRCGVSRNGSKASNVVSAAESYGMTSSGWRLSFARLKTAKPPFVIYWRFSHYMVVEGFRHGRVYVNDPANGPRWMTEQEFSRGYTGITLTMEPGPEFVKAGRPTGLVSSLWPRLRTSRAGVAFVIFAGLALVVPALVTPLFTQVFIDQFLVRGLVSWVTPLLELMAATAAVIAALTWLQQIHLLRLQVKLSSTTSSRFFWHVLRLPISFFSGRFAGDIGSRVALNDNIAALLSGPLATTVVTLFTLVFYLVMLFVYSVPLTLIGIVVAVLNLITLQVVSRRRIDSNRRLLSETAKLTGSTMASLQMIETIKAGGLEDDSFVTFSGSEAEVIGAGQALGSTTQILNAAPVFLAQFNAAIMLTLGALFTIRGDLTVGMLSAFTALMASFVAPFSTLVTLGGRAQQAHADLNRLDDVRQARVDEQLADLRSGKETAPPSGARLQGHLAMRGISFGYDALEEPLICDFDLDILPGQHVALVGPSGSGKTTIANLVCGLYEPWSGEILYDGKPRSEIPRETMVSSVSRVSQDIHLFDGTASENLAMWDTTLTDQKLSAAAEDASIRDVLAARRGGLACTVEENGNNFSGGERQRMEIARALATDPRLVIFDEATSALDPLTEQRIDRSLRRRGCACLIIAHRLSTIRDCDEIIVLDHGKVVERGTHHQLMALEGRYAALVRQ